MEKTTIGNIQKIEETVKENGGTAIIIAKEHNGNGKSEEEKIAKRIRMSNIIESVIAGIEVKKAIEEEAIIEESIATISCNGTKLLIYLNPNGNNEEIKVEAEIRTSIASKHFFLTQINQKKDEERTIDLQMIQKALEKNPELADACKKLFFSKTTIAYN